MKKTNLLLILSLLYIIEAKTRSNDSTVARKKYFTERLKSEITFDGIPQEEAWDAVEWGGDFIQWQPNEGKAILILRLHRVCLITHLPNRQEISF